MTVHEILVGTRNYLQKYGWVTNWGLPRGGPTCLVGALNLASDSAKRIPMQYSLPDERILDQCAHALEFVSYVEAMTWNDRQSSLDVVLDRLDKAIAETAPDPVPVEQLQSNHEFEL